VAFKAVDPRTSYKGHTQMIVKVASLEAVMKVIERRELKAVDGEYQLTAEMMAEAIAIDKRDGTAPSPKKVAELKALAVGKPVPGWESMGSVYSFLSKYKRGILNGEKSRCKRR
jgi:hypothetical protein